MANYYPKEAEKLMQRQKLIFMLSEWNSNKCLINK